MRSELADLLRLLLGSEPPATGISSVEQWWTLHEEASRRFVTSIARACAGGFHADRVAYAFASGYTEAIAAMVPSLRGTRAALCATERGGGHPRAIECALEPVAERFRVVGQKSFVTLGAHAEVLLVVASEGRDDHDRNRLRVVRVPANRPGVHLEELPPMPFAPELPHARVDLAGVLVERAEVLPGDGYEEYVRPFRTVEDLHVIGALLGHLVRVGRGARWNHTHLDALASLVASTFGLAVSDPNDAAVHVALAGTLDQLRALDEVLDWSAVPDEARSRHERDRTLLRVAEAVRQKRLATAWRRLGED